MSSISNTMRDNTKNAMGAGQEAGQAASAGARNIQADLVSLRDEVARLTHQIANIFAAKGTASWQRAKRIWTARSRMPARRAAKRSARSARLATMWSMRSTNR
jgi:hypothetical protein